MGRPKLPKGERLLPVCVRLPPDVVEFFRERANNPTTAMRNVLEKFVERAKTLDTVNS